MLIHGGMISSGRCHCFFVDGSYWISWMQVVLEHDLARRGGDVDAELEGLRVGHRDLELAVAALDVVEQVVAGRLHEVLAAGADRLAEHLGIGQREVRRRQRVDVLAREEVDLLLGVLGQALDAADLVVQPARGDQVRLLDVVEQEVLVPVLVLEALVALRRLDDGLGGRAHHLQHRRLPQAHVVPPEVHLRFGELVRVRQHLGRELHERLAEAELVGEDRARAVGVARRVFAHQLGALFGGGRERFRERDGVVLGGRRGVGGGRGGGGRRGHRGFSLVVGPGRAVV